MGVLSELVLAREDEAEQIANASVPTTEFRGIDVSGIDTIQLCALHALLVGRSFDDLLDQYVSVVVVSDEGPWVYRLPPELVTGLARLSDGQRDSIAVGWASTEELEGTPPEVVAEILAEIADLAKLSIETKQSMFLWMCL